jgi:hypothetical protein
LYVGIVNSLAPIPLALAMLWAPSVALSFAASVVLLASASMWLGPAASTVQDLMLPRMRSLASAAFLMIVTLIGLALGPYTIGRLSLALGDLRPAMALSLLANLVALVLFVSAIRTVGRDEEARAGRAAAAGERV